MPELNKSELNDDDLRLVEAVLFAAAEPLDEKTIAARLPDGAPLDDLLAELQDRYAGRGVHLVRSGGRWALRTADDLAGRLDIETEAPRRLSRAALETLAIVAYHQPVTRAEIEEIRGVMVSKGTLDVLMEADWVRPGRRRDTPGRPLTWLTTPAFLDHFGLGGLKDLPGLKDLRAAGLLDARPAISIYQDRAGEAAGEAGEGAEDETAAAPLAETDEA